MSGQVPSICRMVIYKHRSTKDGSTPHLQSPAVILKVNEDETIDLNVFCVSGGSFFRNKVQQGDDEYQWNWPPRA